VPFVKEEALCLRVWEWSETSQTALVLTRGLGALRVLAKGSRRPRAAFSGGLSLLTRGSAQLIVKPAAPLSSGPDAPLTTMTSWDLEETFPALRRSLRAFYAGMHAADITAKFLHDHDPHPEVLDALIALLRGLEAQGGEARELARFQWEMLLRTGHRPELSRAVDGGVLGDDAVCLFAPSLGGLVASPEAGVEAWRVRRETVAALRSLGGEPGGAPTSESPCWPRACSLLGRYASLVAGVDTPSLTMFLDVFSRDAPPR
jgi:DNA repair protein RecO (recombination protein O)